MKILFGRIWAVWGLLLFVLTMFPMLLLYAPCAWLQEPKRSIWHRRVSRIWMTVFLNGIGCPVKVVVDPAYDKNKRYIIICNHNTLIDIPITTPFLPYANKTIAKKSFAKVPFFGWIYRWGSILVDRKDPRSRVNSYFEMVKALTEWKVDMVLYPEGTRNKTDKLLLPFQKGAFKLAKETGVPILPAVLLYSKEVLPSKPAFCLYPHRLELHILAPVEVDDASAIESLNAFCFHKMHDFLAEQIK